MKKVFLSFIAFAMSNVWLCGQNVSDGLKQVELEEITVSAVRVSSSSSVAHSTIDEQEIKLNNAAKNIPTLLQMLPSVVAYTEGGTSVGNTSLRIRGTDANRINMTLNGMPLNNPETQEVYWVNIPDLSNSLKSLQVQRGVGTTTAGTASFGGNISMQTVGVRPKPYAEISSSYGQYNTFLASMATGSGILKNGLSLDARYSYIKSDGYIRNGKVNHKNLYATLSHYTAKQMAKIVYINGIQHTGITWEGVNPEEKARDRRYNPAGRYEDQNGLTQYYDNETDNYYSHIVQGLYSRYLTNEIAMNANFGYNGGYGYYENYKTDQKLKKFGLENQIINGVEYVSSDLIRRKLMRNNLYSGGVNASYKTKKVDVTIGVDYTYFEGDHYGKLLWMKYNNTVPANYEWYRNNATKKGTNSFVKLTCYSIEKLTITAEMQGRFVNYEMKGVDDDLAKLGGDNSYSFFNPKLGTVYHLNNGNEAYASFAISNREPLRADLKESQKGEVAKGIESERLFDYEFGYRHRGSSVSFGANLYYMHYKDQLIQTGKLSDTGYKFQENVPNSYRCGVELEAMYRPAYWVEVGGNLTWSKNKMKNYTAYYDYYDNQEEWKWLGQVSEFHKKTNISFSPNVVSSAVVRLKPMKNEDLSITFSNKYVSSMFYDNTSNEKNKLAEYFTTDFQLSYSKDIRWMEKLEFQLMINNIFNRKYDANAWVDTSKFADGSTVVYKGLFPQARANVMGRVVIEF